MENGFTTVYNFRTGTMERVSVDGLLTLANAIIIRACDDYKSRDYQYRRFPIEKFLKSEYANLLMRGCCSPDKIINYLSEVVSHD